MHLWVGTSLPCLNMTCACRLADITTAADGFGGGAAVVGGTSPVAGEFSGRPSSDPLPFSAPMLRLRADADNAAASASDRQPGTAPAGGATAVGCFDNAAAGLHAGASMPMAITGRRKSTCAKCKK